jgi:hypothetical protein
MKPTAEDTFSLYKATTFVELAGQYLDLILLNKDIRSEARAFLKQERHRLTMFIIDFNNRLGDEAKETVKAHFRGDLLVFDAVFDKMADMSEEQRQAVEEFCEQIKMKKAI